jgi:hypothetical protein
VKHAVRKGWRVEMWAWSHSCSGEYRAMQEDVGIVLNFLDPYKETITYSLAKKKIGRLARSPFFVQPPLPIHPPLPPAINLAVAPRQHAAAAVGVNEGREPCLICVLRPRETKNLPCGHVMLCKKCSEIFDECLMCGEKTDSVVSV